MAITVTLALDAGVILVGQPKRAFVTIQNSDPYAIKVKGINIEDSLKSLTCGDFIPALPVKYQTNTFTNPVVSQIPAWGTADQSTKTITGVDLDYPINNSDTITTADIDFQGSYAGGGTFGVQNNVIVPVGVGMIGYVDIICSSVNWLETALPVSLSVVADVEYIDPAVPTVLNPAVSNVVSSVVSTKPVSGIRLAPINSTGLIAKNVWSRPPEYSNFDVAIQTLLVFTDSTTTDVTGWAGHAFASSNGNWTVVSSAPYSGQAPAAIPNAYNSTPSFPVGSIPPGGWQGTRLVGGAGACTMGTSAGDTPLTSTITDTFLSLYVATIDITQVQRFPVGIVVSPAIANLVGVNNNVNLDTRLVYNDGTTSANLEGGVEVPVYSIVAGSAGLATVNSATGVVTQNTAGPSQITVRSAVPYTYGGTTLAFNGYALISTN